MPVPFPESYITNLMMAEHFENAIDRERSDQILDIDPHPMKNPPACAGGLLHYRPKKARIKAMLIFRSSFNRNVFVD
jgi:hypothetical protein